MKAAIVPNYDESPTALSRLISCLAGRRSQEILTRFRVTVLLSAMERITAADNLNAALRRAAEIIREGGIVAYATETFYGLGADSGNETALRRLYDLKRRPFEKAMPVIIGTRDLLPLIASSVPPLADILAAACWPGPLTLLLPARDGLSPFISGTGGKVAVRIPGASFALDLARHLGIPITATSANISGSPPADNPDQVEAYFGDELDLLIDTGKSPGGAPSTIVDVMEDNIVIRREGAIPSAAIHEIITAHRG